ncbi:sulfotransferase 2B1-like [Ptychodera flava]|uniref:sulfotransferase 2B1-like n=1 Tax=Ptychodera flava TaxID=63121 RepID=UPI00396A5741
MAKEWSGFFYRGCYFPNCVYNIETVKSNPMDQWDIRPDDVVVLTYPKSGTFWMLNLLSSLYTDLNLLLPASNKVVRLDQFYEDADDVPGSYGKHAKAMKESLHAMPSPRLLFCHLPFQLFPRAWQDSEKKCKIIYIARNPKDVCVSYYHYTQGIPWAGMDLNWDEWIRAFVDGKVRFGSWLDHVLGWRRFGLEDNTSFVERRRTFFVSSVRHLRKGQVGDWKNHFLVSQNEFFDREITVKAENDGQKFVYHM